MFEKIVLRRSESGTPITAGQVAEAMVFYQNVHLIIDQSSLGQLIRQVGIGTLLSLFRRSDCTAVYCEQMLGTHTEAVGPMHAHAYVALEFVGHQGTGTFNSREDRLALLMSRQGVSHADCKRFSKAFLKAVPVRKYSSDVFVKGGIANAARQDANDKSFALPAIERALKLTPGANDIGDSLRFDIVDTELGFYVSNNIDFDVINQRRARLHPPLDAISNAYLLNQILEVRADLSLASFYGRDFVSSDLLINRSAPIRRYFASP